MTSSVSRERVGSKGSGAKTRTLRASAKHSEFVEAEEEEKEKKKILRVKPKGIDTVAANRFVGQLNNFLKNNDTTPEEKEQLNRIAKNTRS